MTAHRRVSIHPVHAVSCRAAPAYPTHPTATFPPYRAAPRPPCSKPRNPAPAARSPTPRMAWSWCQIRWTVDASQSQSQSPQSFLVQKATHQPRSHLALRCLITSDHPQWDAYLYRPPFHTGLPYRLCLAAPITHASPIPSHSSAACLPLTRTHQPPPAREETDRLGPADASASASALPLLALRCVALRVEWPPAR